MQDFARMQLEEIRDNIASRRNRIFLLMEEVSCACKAFASGMALGSKAGDSAWPQVRRLRIQQRIKAREQNALTLGVEEEMPEYPSSIPFLPPLVSGVPMTSEVSVTCFLAGSNCLLVCLDSDNRHLTTILRLLLPHCRHHHRIRWLRCAYCKPSSCWQPCRPTLAVSIAQLHPGSLDLRPQLLSACSVGLGIAAYAEAGHRGNII